MLSYQIQVQIIKLRALVRVAPSWSPWTPGRSPLLVHPKRTCPATTALSFLLPITHIPCRYCGRFVGGFDRVCIHSLCKSLGSLSGLRVCVKSLGSWVPRVCRYLPFGRSSPDPVVKRRRVVTDRLGAGVADHLVHRDESLRAAVMTCMDERYQRACICGSCHARARTRRSQAS